MKLKPSVTFSVYEGDSSTAHDYAALIFFLTSSKITSQLRQQVERILTGCKKPKKEYWVFLIPDYISKQYAAYHSILNDLKFVSSALTELDAIVRGIVDKPSSSQNIQMSSLWYASLSTYGKCFNSGELKMEAKDCFKDNVKLIDVHDQLIELRNKLVSHRDQTEYYQSVVFYFEPKDKLSNEQKKHYELMYERRVSPDSYIVENFHEILEHLIPVVTKKLEKSTRGMHMRFASMPLEEKIQWFVK